MISDFATQITVGSIVLARPQKFSADGRVNRPTRRFRIVAVHSSHVSGVLCSKRGIMFTTSTRIRPSEIVDIEYRHDALAQFALHNEIVPMGTTRKVNYVSEINKAQRKIAEAEKMISKCNRIIIDQQRLLIKLQNTMSGKE